MNVALHSLNPRKRALTVASWALMVASPFLLLGAVSAVIGQNAFQANPVWTDELDYWRGIFSWLHLGGSAGYKFLESRAPFRFFPELWNVRTLLGTGY